MAQHVVVTEYSPLWEKQFEEEAEKIREILGENCRAVYHIGSTSVEGLKAKPIIDIMPVVKSLEETDRRAGEFEKIGYEYLGEFGIPGRRYLRKGGDERTHQVHIFEAGNKMEIERHLAVRDYLRSHRERAREYGQLKERLALLHPYDIEEYCDGKDEFVKTLEREALLWRKLEEKR